MPAGPKASTSRRIVVWCIVLALCVSLVGYAIMRPTPNPPLRPEVRRAAPVALSPRQAFFDSDVLPAIEDTDKANREAAERCVDRVRGNFKRYRDGIVPFADDMTSWSTRWGVVSRMPGDWWYERQNVTQFVEAKFEKNLFSEEALKRDVETALAAFRDDVAANNNALVGSIKASVASSDVSEIPDIDYGTLAGDIGTSLTSFAADSAVDSVTRFLITEIASGTAGYAAEQLVVAIAARLSVMAATSATTAGGVTAGTTAVGGGGGSLAGPVGTVVGISVGLVVGVIIDWWMTESFEHELKMQMNEMIGAMETAVLEGGGDNAGMRKALDESCDALRDAYQRSLYERIVRGGSND